METLFITGLLVFAWGGIVGVLWSINAEYGDDTAKKIVFTSAVTSVVGILLCIFGILTMARSVGHCTITRQRYTISTDTPLSIDTLAWKSPASVPTVATIPSISGDIPRWAQFALRS